MSAEYDAILANLDQNISRSGEHLDDMLDDYTRTIGRLREDSAAVPHEVSAVIRCLEAIGAEALMLVALVSHRREDHAMARQAIDRLRRLERITMRELRPHHTGTE